MTRNTNVHRGAEPGTSSALVSLSVCGKVGCSVRKQDSSWIRCFEMLALHESAARLLRHIMADHASTLLRCPAHGSHNGVPRYFFSGCWEINVCISYYDFRGGATMKGTPADSARRRHH